MTTKTLEQRRAGHALKSVESVATKSFAGRYRSYAEALPAHILMGGLGQAVATELAAARGGEGTGNDGRCAHRQLVSDLEGWLAEEGVFPNRKDNPTKAGAPLGWLPNAIIGSEQQQYARAQAEALSWLVWLKKFCQATLPKTAGDSGDE